jgi:hypothetical protein
LSIPPCDTIGGLYTRLKKTAGDIDIAARNSNCANNSANANAASKCRPALTIPAGNAIDVLITGKSKTAANINIASYNRNGEDFIRKPFP